MPVDGRTIKGKEIEKNSNEQVINNLQDLCFSYTAENSNLLSNQVVNVDKLDVIQMSLFAMGYPASRTSEYRNCARLYIASDSSGTALISFTNKL